MDWIVLLCIAIFFVFALYMHLKPSIDIVKGDNSLDIYMYYNYYGEYNLKRKSIRLYSKKKRN